MSRHAVTPPGSSTPPTTVTCIGYTVLDAVWTGQKADHSAGGTAANVAANLAWLGVDVSLCARIGCDAAGGILAADLHAAGVDISGVITDPAVRTPVLVHDARSARPRYLFSCPRCGNPAASYRPPVVAPQLWTDRTPAVVFFDRPSVFALETARRVSDLGGKVMFEPNSVGRRQLCEAAIALADIVKLSDDRPDELTKLLDDAPRRQLQVRTAGDRGLFWRFDGLDWRHESAQPVPAVDTSGAGDWATAGLLSVLAAGGPWSTKLIRHALSTGQMLAARSCEFAGARGMSYSLAAADVLPGAPSLPLLSRSTALPPTVGCSVCLDSDVTDRREVLAATSR